MGVKMPGVEPRIKHSRDVYISAEFKKRIPQVYHAHLQEFCEDRHLGEGAHRASYTLPETAERVISALAAEYGTPEEIAAEKAAKKKRAAEMFAEEDRLRKAVEKIASIEDAVLFFRQQGFELTEADLGKDPEGEMVLTATEEGEYYERVNINPLWKERINNNYAFRSVFAGTAGSYLQRLLWETDSDTECF